MLTRYVLPQGTFYGFSSRKISIGESHYEIVATRSTGPGVYDALFTLKNLSTGVRGELPMARLIRLVQSQPQAHASNPDRKTQKAFTGVLALQAGR